MIVLLIQLEDAPLPCCNVHMSIIRKRIIAFHSIKSVDARTVEIFRATNLFIKNAKQPFVKLLEYNEQ